MRVPVPTNKLVAFTLVGALLTGVLAVSLALPGLAGGDSPTADTGGPIVASDAPTPNANFTPAVATQSSPPSHEEDERGEEHDGEEEYE